MGERTTPLDEAPGFVGSASGPTLIYLHIGKTAGVTLHQVLQRQFPSSRTLWLHGSIVAGGATAGDDPSASVPPGSEARPTREMSLEYVASLPPERLARVRLVEGHIIFGLHRLLPRPSVYATFLREPIARVISGYGYIRRRPRHPLYALSHRLPLDAFLRSGAAIQLDNGQTRAIAGDTTTAFGACGPELLAAARRNIEDHFVVVGLTERFDESLLLMRRAFGWRNVHYVPANVSRRPPSTSVIDARTRGTIEEFNGSDLQLYEWVRERLEGAIEAASGLPELRRFRRMNALYRPWGRLTHTFPRAILAAVRRGGSGRTAPDR
jgi:hypothetical protein